MRALPVAPEVGPETDGNPTGDGTVQAAPADREKQQSPLNGAESLTRLDASLRPR